MYAMQLARLAMVAEETSALARLQVPDPLPGPHDLLLRGYLDTDESHELSRAFAERRKPEPETVGH